MHKLSIITINKNNREGLRRTIESVVSQTFQEFEYIVIDGASTDGSAELIPEYPRIDYSVSEPDTGIYNAMNKGAQKATGTYCLFLNSGDFLYSKNTLLSIHADLDGSDIIYGDLETFKITRPGCLLKSPVVQEISILTFLDASIPHPSSFIKREVLSKYGWYREDLMIVSDWAFFLDCYYISNSSFKYVPSIISSFNLNGFGTDLKNRTLLEDEKRNVLTAIFPKLVNDFYKYSYANKVITARGVRLTYLVNVIYRKIRNVFAYLR